MDVLTSIINAFRSVINQIVDFFKDFVKLMRGIGDEDLGKKDDATEEE